jgi:thiamine kinase
VGEVRISELTRVGAGREAEIYAWGEDQVLRLARTRRLKEEVERERIALEVVGRCGASVPAVYERVEVDGRPGLVLERLAGHDLLGGLLRRPWELVSMPWTLARLHASLHEIAAPEELPKLRSEVARRLRSELVPKDLGVAALQALDQLSDGDRLCHGDFHPGNVMRRRGGGHAVIDWKNAMRGDPAADVARTRLLIVGAWIPGSMPRPLQIVLWPFRLLLYLAYRLIYRFHRTVRHRDVAAWIPVLAAARLAEDIPQERTRLRVIARWGLRRHRRRR